MASYTTNLNLIKPADSDSYDVANDNGNMDKIDVWAGTTNTAIGNKADKSNTFTSQRSTSGSVDCNGYNKTGSYYGTWTSNYPTGASASGYLVVIMLDTETANYCKQYYTPYNSNATYLRTNNNGTWTSWEQLAPKSETVKAEYKEGTTSFAALDSNSYVSKALDNLHADIANQNTGIVYMSSSGGPVFHIMLGKYNATYYSGYITTYASATPFYSIRFAYENGKYMLWKMT